MIGYIKHFEYGGKNMPFFIKDDDVWEKCEQILDLIKKKLVLNFIIYLFMIKKILKLK